MIKRLLALKIKSVAAKFPIVAVVGPRQSGKTTLTRYLFPEKTYVNLENPDTREFALRDPRGFLEHYDDAGAVIDEIQRVPHLFSYLQTRVDAGCKNGRYILTSSRNFLPLENISQSLAGRISVQYLLPLSLEELEGTRYAQKSPDAYLFKGFYPRRYDQKIEPSDWFAAYLQTYIERDIRQVKNVTDLNAFQRFVKLCAGRAGQISISPPWPTIAASRTIRPKPGFPYWKPGRSSFCWRRIT